MSSPSSGPGTNSVKARSVDSPDVFCGVARPATKASIICALLTAPNLQRSASSTTSSGGADESASSHAKTYASHQNRGSPPLASNHPDFGSHAHVLIATENDGRDPTEFLTEIARSLASRRS